MFVAITIHHHVPEHEEALRGFMDEVAAAVDLAPGLIEFTTCRDSAGRYLAGYSRWESEDAFRRALPTIRAMAPRRNPDWTSEPDEPIRLASIRS